MSGKTTGMTIMSSETSADNCAPKEKHSSAVWRKTTSSKSSLLEVSVVHNEMIHSFRGWLLPDSLTKFPVLSEWSGNKEDDDDVNVWEDNWDDDNVEDDFSKQLRAQLESQKK